MKRFAVLWVMGILSLTLVLGACAQKEALAPQVFKWKNAIYQAPTSSTTLAFIWWGDEIRRLTNGRLDITPYPGGQLSGEKEVIDGVSTGMFQLGTTSPSTIPGKIPLSTLTTLAFVLPPRPDHQVLAQDALFLTCPQIVAELDKLNVIYATTLGAELYNYMGSKPIRTTADFKGVRIRMAPGFVPVLKEFGAVPTTMPITEVYTSMDTGLVDGAITFTMVFHTYKLFEVAKYWVTGLDLGGSPALMVMNKNAWNSLPDDIKKVIVDMRPRMAKKFQEISFDPAAYAKPVEAFKAKGIEHIEFPPGEKAKLVAKAGGAWEDWIKQNGGDPARKALQFFTEARDKIVAQYPDGVK